jgi:hypothetical protein
MGLRRDLERVLKLSFAQYPVAKLKPGQVRCSRLALRCPQRETGKTAAFTTLSGWNERDLQGRTSKQFRRSFDRRLADFSFLKDRLPSP